MKRFISPAVCAAAILLSSVSIDAILAPATAQDSYQVDFDTFHDQLAPYGDWVYSDRWGEVWIPTDVPNDFRPYDTDGHWAYTDEYGWMWASDYEWGDIPFHYGRWVNDPDDGWLWIPGYIWSPAWVLWRSNGQYAGWMPMPPDPDFLGGSNVSFGVSFGRRFGLSFNFGNANDFYGYAQWYPDYGEDRFASNWVFVNMGHLADRDFGRYRAPRADYATIIRNTTNITNYTVTNNYVVNRSIDPRAVQRAGGRPVVAVHAAQVIKRPAFVMPANQGQEIQARMRTESPRGSGMANSAPKPSPQVVQSLSTNIKPRNGRPAPTHLYTRETVTKAPLPNRPAANPPSNQMGPGNATAPSATRPGENAPSGNAGPGMMHPEREKQTPSNNATSPSSPATTNPNGTENTSTPEMRRRRGNEGGPGSAAPGEATPGENPNGMTGPGGATRFERERQTPSNNATSPSSPATTNPNGTENTSTPEMKRRRGNEGGPGSAAPGEATPGENPNGMTGPGGATRFEREKQTPSNNAMSPPSPATTNPNGTGESTSAPEMRHRQRNEGGPNPSAPENQMMSPNGPNGPGPGGGSMEERPRMEQRSNGNLPPANAGPGASGRPATATPRTLQQPPPERMRQEAPPPQKSQEPEKKHKPDEKPQ